jgi:dihydrofolate reductase
MDEEGCIGFEGRVPWHLSADLKRFKRLTMGHHLIMGRLTYQSIGFPLPGRTNIVVTRTPAYLAPGCQVVYSLEKALALAQGRGESEAFIIGGGQIFAISLDLADRLYLTRVHARVDCDVFFPTFEPGDWVEVESVYQPADEQNQYSFTFQLFERKG